MTYKVQQEVLDGFIAEAQSYLPSIREGIFAFQSSPDNTGLLEEAYRQAHIIKGAASMVGLPELSYLAGFVEQILEEILNGTIILNMQALAVLDNGLSCIEACLDRLGENLDDLRTIVSALYIAYRRLAGLPADEDSDAVAEIMDAIAAYYEKMEEEVLEEDAFAEQEQPEAPPAPAPPAEPAGPVMADIPPELLEVFMLEAEDHLKNITVFLESLKQNPHQKDVLQSLRRSVHTLKGSSAAVGFRVVSTLAHRMEDLLDRLFEGAQALDQSILELLTSSAEALEDLASNTADNAFVQSLYGKYDRLLQSKEEKAAPAEKKPAAPQAAAPGEPAQPAAAAAPMPAHARPEEMVRIGMDRIDEIMRLMGELVISRSSIEQYITDLTNRVENMAPTIERLKKVSERLETEYEISALGDGLAGRRGKAQSGGRLAMPVFAEHDFDELELDRYTEFHHLLRQLSETIADIKLINTDLGNVTSDFESMSHVQGRLSSDMQDKLMKIRMMPISSIAARMRQIVRVIALAQNKLVDMVIEGEQMEIDKKVLDSMIDPLMHILRNNVDHGIEPPEERKAKGKTERGIIRLRAYYSGNKIVLAISDDGRGLDADKIRRKAIAAGYIDEEGAARLTSQDIFQYVLLPNFSTADKISEFSGRGVGMDVVKTQVNALQGTVEIESVKGQGTLVIIRLPMSLAVTRSLLMKSYNNTFAVPLGFIKQVLRLEPGEIEQTRDGGIVHVEDIPYPLLRLGDVLGLPRPAEYEESPTPLVLLLDIGAQYIAMTIDELLGEREIVVKNLGTHLRRVPGIAGATLLGDGSVVLILNPLDLASLQSQNKGISRTLAEQEKAPAEKMLSVLIVDDSVSVRMIMTNFIKSSGWLPITAKDGVEALEILQAVSQQPDIILLDVEMPRMDGYELLSRLKSNAVHRSIPVVMITSRSSEKHRMKALEMGAADYVIKPYQDELLKNLIEHLISQPKF
ncbi:MAG: Hpt domain-containing protein [Deltaproteobacteria bacterium]|nr:Hpt domain-containing protein [Deltaproteobacteria bacterium]